MLLSNDVLVDLLPFLHGQVVQLVLRISNQIMLAKIGLQFRDELMVVVHPDGTGIGVGDIEYVRFEPLEGHASKIGLHIGNFSMVHGKGLRTVLEVQLA